MKVKSGVFSFLFIVYLIEWLFCIDVIIELKIINNVKNGKIVRLMIFKNVFLEDF